MIGERLYGGMASPHFPPYLLGSDWLESSLTAAASARVAVFGDLCLDAYWLLDETKEEISVETGLAVHRVNTQRYSPGGGGNVAANLRALGVRDIRLIGIVGQDLFGGELLKQFALRGIGTDHIEVSAEWNTLVYAKPYRGTNELNRLDFGGAKTASAPLIAKLLGRIEAAAQTYPVVVINQQIVNGLSEALMPQVAALVARYPATLFLVDSRQYAGSFPGAALKLNRSEAARILGRGGEAALEPDALAEALAAKQGQPVLITRGEEGLVLAAGGQLFDVPGIDLPGAVDAVGAGDAALAGFAAALASGSDPMPAACLANLAAAVTTRQIRTTGTAQADLLLAVGPAPDYRYYPRLAAQPRLAHYLPETTIEVVSGRRPVGRIRHAVFDHDGTLSTLRQGWEAIMEPMMMKAIAGPALRTLSDSAFAALQHTVRAYIDHTTGAQTLAQMRGLVDLVREYGRVPQSEILDEHGYKAIFNRELLEMVDARRRRLERGELASADFQIKNAGLLLERLARAGITLHLASGTDQADVQSEAKAMGYAPLFSGGIYGSVGNLKIEAKREVMQRILGAPGIQASEVIILGDGPVEIREGIKHGAFTVGVASDEVRRHDVDLKKRSRLIRAGADLVVSDYSQCDALLTYLGIPF